MAGYNYGSSLTIEETVAVAGAQGRRIVLLGPALPFMGAEWGFENRVITTWYPGNSVEATQQTLGPVEMPSTWEGEWNRTRMGRTPTLYFDENGQQSRVVSPHVLRELFEDIARSGARLRVVWSAAGTTASGHGASLAGGGTPTDVDVKIVREGLVKQFKTPIDRHTDIRWSATFDWASRGGQQSRVAGVSKDSDLAKAADGVEQSVNVALAAADSKIKSIKAGVRKSASTLTLGQLEAVAGAPLAAVNDTLRGLQQNVSQFKRIGQIAKVIRTQPESIASSVLDFAHNTVAVAKQFSDDFTGTPAELLSTKTRASSISRSARYLGAQHDAILIVARKAQELAAKTREVRAAQNERGGEVPVRDSSSSRAGDIIAVHVAKQGDSPQTISVRYYKDPDHGADILRANRLPAHTPAFRAGQILIIPALVRARSA